MDEQKEIRNFYEEESMYEKNTELIKQLIEKVVDVDLKKLDNKISNIDEEKKFDEYIDLLQAVIGMKTNKYYYCQDEEYVKYYNLEIGKIYKLSKLNPEIQNRHSKEQVLNLHARAKLAIVLLEQTNELKKMFLLKFNNVESNISAVEENIILGEDIIYLENLIKYLNLIINNIGRLKILVSEQEVYKKIKINEKLAKKGNVGKFIYKLFNKGKK